MFEGLQLPMDLALAVESRYFAKILRSKEAAAMIRSLFLSKGELDKGARRPAGEPATTLKKIGVLGAGFMGAGVAYVSRERGARSRADRPRPGIRRQGQGPFRKADLHARSPRAAPRAPTATRCCRASTPTPNYEDLKGCDLVVEAVFEDRGVKQEATEKAQAVVGADVIFASNTSTLPITSLAETSQKPENFIGIHFFSPVDKMMLVEIIMGEKTGPKALATAIDFVRAIKKTPIVVNDCRGFYANRCVGNYIREGHLMLMEGVPPAMIENAARMAGMPVGPLSLNDEVGDRPRLEDPAGDQEGPRRQRRRSRAGEADRGDGRQAAALRPQERQGILRLSRAGAEVAVAGPWRTSPASARSRHDLACRI